MNNTTTGIENGYEIGEVIKEGMFNGARIWHKRLVSTYTEGKLIMGVFEYVKPVSVNHGDGTFSTVFVPE
jgi:hypothetical protein